MVVLFHRSLCLERIVVFKRSLKTFLLQHIAPSTLETIAFYCFMSYVSALTYYLLLLRGLSTYWATSIKFFGHIEQAQRWLWLAVLSRRWLMQVCAQLAILWISSAATVNVFSSVKKTTLDEYSETISSGNSFHWAKEPDDFWTRSSTLKCHQDLLRKKTVYNPLNYNRRRYLLDDTFGCFDITPACVTETHRWTDGQTQGYSIHYVGRPTALA